MSPHLEDLRDSDEAPAGLSQCRRGAQQDHVLEGPCLLAPGAHGNPSDRAASGPRPRCRNPIRGNRAEGAR